MKVNRIVSIFLPLTLAGALVACGDEPEPDPEFLAAPGAAITLSNDLRGINLRPLQSLFGNPDFVVRDFQAASAAVIELQTYGEFEQTQSADRTAPRITSRIEALYDQAAVGPAIVAADRRYLVVDLQRLDRQWVNDWRGLDRDSPDNRAQSLTFQIRADQHDSDLQLEVTESILDALESANGTIESVVVGIEMDRWYDENPGDWVYYVQWVHSLRDELRAAQPGIRVGAGINWHGFMANVVPAFAVDGVVDFVAVRDAWNAVIDPLYFDEETETTLLDFYAFSALADAASFQDTPELVTWEQFAGIETMFRESPERASIPVAWFSVGWMSLSESFEPAARYLQRFLGFNGGYDVELVSWTSYVNLTSTECTKHTGSEVGASPTVCFSGMYSRVPLFTQTGLLEAAYFGR